MKKFTISLMTAALTLLMCGIVQATEFQTRGSAVVPCMGSKYASADSYQNSVIFITNVSGCDVTCRITFYDHNGVDVTTFCKIYSGSNTSATPVTIATGTGTFDMPAGSSRWASFNVSQQIKYIQGHAVIEWSSEDTKIRKALIAIGRLHNYSYASDSAMSIPINNGQAF